MPVAVVPRSRLVLVASAAFLASCPTLFGCTSPDSRDRDVVRAESETKTPVGPMEEGLEETCDLLVNRQGDKGEFLAEGEAWWPAGFCVRALLAGHVVLGDPRYLDGAIRVIDRFVAEQEYDGSWSAYANGSYSPWAPLSFNLADIGSMLACLSLAVPYVDSDRSQRYIDAHRKYVERFLPKHDIGNGAFRNGWFEGEDLVSEYTVATATQTLSLCSLYKEVSEERFLWRAERACRFLLHDWHPDGQPTLHPHDTAETRVLHSLEFHNIFYILEALLAVHESTHDTVLRKDIEMVVDRYLNGSQGLLTQPHDPWVDLVENKTKVKALGMVGILDQCQRLVGPSERLVAMTEGGKKHIRSRLEQARLEGEATLHPAELGFLGLSFGIASGNQVGILGERRAELETQDLASSR